MTGGHVDDVYRSDEFQALHTLQRRLGAGRRIQERPYADMIRGLSSLQAPPARRRLRFLHRRTRRGS
jgi:hypothetical protein